MAEPSSGTFLRRFLRPVADLRSAETTTALLMFAYSFLAMTSYNIIKPITRSEFISSLGADNLPWVQFASGILIGIIMQAYSVAMRAVPRRWTIPVTQAGMIGLLVLFWFLFTTVGAEWVSVGFYLVGLILGILLISQFWTLANDVYDPRQAKRIFGFIGGGASLGGALGAGLTKFLVEELGSRTMLLLSAVIMGVCLFIVMSIIRREASAGTTDASKTGEEESVSSGEALQLLGSSRHLQIIALVIGFAAIGAAIIEQQLNMATAEAKGAENADAIAAFLAEITIYLSLAGFVIQVAVTSRIHRLLGIGFALMILPVSLGASGVLMLLNGALWTAGLARVLDTALRYTVDKTSREILFLPLPSDVKYRAKPFIDVTVDRLAKGAGALLILVLIKDWGLGLSWRQLSFASLTMMGLWIVFALLARREYLRSFRRSIEQQDMQAAEIRLDTADLSTIETLVGELAHPEPRRVLYAIDLLESLDKRHLVTPLLLFHESPEVRARTLRVAEAAGSAGADRWKPAVERALKDGNGDVRLAAMRAAGAMHQDGLASTMRPYLSSSDPRLVVTAASALAGSADDTDVSAAEDAFRRLADDTRDQEAAVRLEVAQALGSVQNPRFHALLVPLMYDADLAVARAAILSAGKVGASDFLFVPPLVSLLRNRLLKGPARQVLVGYGDGVVDALAYFLRDRDEDQWVRRHVPSTLAQIPTQHAMQVLVDALADSDGFVRFKSVAAIEHLRQDHPDLTVDSAVVEAQINGETARAFNALTLHHNLFASDAVRPEGMAPLDPTCLLARALNEKRERAMDRIFRLLALVNAPGDIRVVRMALNGGDNRSRSSATEYLDNLLKGDIRRRVMLLVEDMPPEERVRRGNVLYKTRVRDLEDTVAQLIHDDDQVIAAAAIHMVEERQLWSLADDLEHVLAHRDVRDWYVFEAASWALAAHRMPPERRRALWAEPLPAVELAHRLTQIRLFDFASVDELFRIAGLGRQVRHEPGRILYERGHAPERLQFLLDGRVTARGADGEPRGIDAPAALAFEEQLEGSPMRSTIRAVDASICLSLTTDEFLSLLAENVEIAQGIFRMLMTEGAREWRTVAHGRLSAEIESRVASGGLHTLDRVLLLQTSPLLARATGPQLLRLASIARPVTLDAESDPFAGSAESSLILMLGGEVSVQSIAGADTAGPGDVIGIYDTLGGVSSSLKATVTKPGSGLRFTRSDLFDLLADNTDLLQGIFSGLLHERRGVPAAARSTAPCD